MARPKPKPSLQGITKITDIWRDLTKDISERKIKYGHMHNGERFITPELPDMILTRINSTYAVDYNGEWWPFSYTCKVTRVSNDYKLENAK